MILCPITFEKCTIRQENVTMTSQKKREGIVNKRLVNEWNIKYVKNDREDAFVNDESSYSLSSALSIGVTAKKKKQ